MDFEDLNETHVAEILDQYYPGSHHRDEFPNLPEAIVRKTSGQPAFIREVVTELVSGPPETRLFEREETGGWRSRTVENYRHIVDELPVRYADILESKLERLPPECREALEFAALVGFEFPTEILESLLPDAAVLDEALDALEVANLIVAQDLDLTQYAFTSSLIPGLVRNQIAAGGSRAAARKRGRVADAVISLFGAAPERAEWIGLLLLDLGRQADAVPYLQEGLSRRMGAGQFADAASLIDRIEAIEGVERADVAQEVKWTLVKAKALSALGRPEEALACTRAGVALAETTGDAVQRSEFLLVEGEIEIRRGDAGAAAGPIEELFEQWDALPGSIRASAQYALALVRRGQNRRDEAVGLLRKSLAEEVADQTPRQALEREARGQNNLGVVLFEQGERDEAERCFARTATIAKQLENYDFQATAAVWLANVHFMSARLEIAR